MSQWVDGLMGDFWVVFLEAPLGRWVDGSMTRWVDGSMGRWIESVGQLMGMDQWMGKCGKICMQNPHAGMHASKICMQNVHAESACEKQSGTQNWLCTVNLHAMKQRDHWELIIALVLQHVISPNSPNAAATNAYF